MEVAIGVDPAKGSLAVSAVDPLGRVLDAREFFNDPRGHRALLGWIRERGPNRVIGIECSLSYGASLSRHLLGAGEDVREVPTTLTARERRRRHAQGKSDLVDSVAIARIVASGEVLSSAHRVGVLTDLRALVDYRDQLVRARTQVANRAHADLVEHPTRVRAGGPQPQGQASPGQGEVNAQRGAVGAGGARAQAPR